jgi:hypothetical protein
MEKFHYRLLKMLNAGRSGNNAASQPEYDPQTEAPPVGSYYEFINAIDDPLAALSIAVQNIADFSMSARINAI